MRRASQGLELPAALRPVWNLDAMESVRHPVGVYRAIPAEVFHPQELDDPDVPLVEVTVTWNHDLLHVAHLRSGEVFALADWPSARALIAWERDQVYVAPLGGDLEIDDGRCVESRATPLPLREGVTARVVFGGVVFAVRRAKALRVRLPTCRPDARFRIVWALTVLVTLALLAAARASGGPSRAALFHTRMRDLDARVRQLERRGVLAPRLLPEARATFEARPGNDRRYHRGIISCCFCISETEGCCATSAGALHPARFPPRGRRVQAVLLNMHRAWSAAGTEAVPNATRAAILRGVQRHAAEVRHCFVSARKASAGMDERMVICWIVGANGSVLTSAVTAGDASVLGACLVKSVTTWRFPRGAGHEPLVVTYAFAFRARE